MKIKKYLFIFLIYSLTPNIVYAIQPDVFVQSTVNRASKILSENISTIDKINKLKLEEKSINVELTARETQVKNYEKEIKFLDQHLQKII